MTEHARNIAAKVVSHASIHAALSAAQEDLQDPPRDKVVDTSKYKFKYADLAAVMAALRPVMHRHGLSVVQRTQVRDGMVFLLTDLSHASGTTISGEYPVCSTNTNHQQMGAAMTYSRRQAISAMFCITSVDDVDAEPAGNVNDGPKVRMTAHQAKTEINWAAIQEAIDSAKTLEKIAHVEKRVKANDGIWPGSYTSQAKDRIQAARIAYADAKMAEARDVDALNEVFAEMEAALDKFVHWDDLAALHKKHEARILA